MRWRGGRQSQNVEDRRRMAGPVAVGGGAGVLILALVIALLGGDPRQFLQQVNQQQAGPARGGDALGEAFTPEEEEAAAFARTVLAYSEDVWGRLFAERGSTYQEPTMVLFSDQVQSACGFASAASGPFYCPPDQRVYLDTSFFAQLERDLNAPGDFAQAYVIAHEVGHHVQNLLGYTDKLDRVRQQVSQEEYNQYSVRLELHADFLAGVMLHHAQRAENIIEPGDVEEALRAASAIGDDRLQRQSQGYVVPESFTHGTSEQRLTWFNKGLTTGDLTQGDTFSDL